MVNIKFFFLIISNNYRGFKMNFNKIIMFINLILMIYSCNAVIVHNYDQNKYINKSSAINLEQIEKVITTITITDENDNTIYVNAFVNAFTIYFLRSLIKEKLNIKTITYSYDNNLITMSNIETNLLAVKNNKIYTISNKHSPQSEIENLSTLFLNDTSQTYIFNNMNNTKFNLQTLSTYLNEKGLESIDLYYPYISFIKDDIFDLQSMLISMPNWYIMAKINGTIDNKFKIIPVKVIDSHIYLYKLSNSIMTRTSKIFMSLNNDRFTSDDVGAYLIYKTQKKHLKIFAQITGVHTTKDHTQILFLQLFYTGNIYHNMYAYYNQYNSSSMGEGDSFKQPVPYEHLTHEELSLTGQDSEQPNPRKRLNSVNAYPENSQSHKTGENYEIKVSKVSKTSVDYKILSEFTCPNINELGNYKFGNIIIHVTQIDEQALGSSFLYIYNIKGNYDYGTTINQNFYSCHIGDDSSNNKAFLIINNITGDRFYPNGMTVGKN